jgi:ATPase subunit of ABC transporter with duplicated ATPase domains
MVADSVVFACLALEHPHVLLLDERTFIGLDPISN